MTDKLAQIETRALAVPDFQRTMARAPGVMAADVLALVEIARAAQDVVATTRITEDGTFVSEGAARNLAAAVARLKENE